MGGIRRSDRSIDPGTFTFGVEVECAVPRDLNIQIGNHHAGLQVAQLPRGWTAEYDGSLSAPAGMRDVEIVSPVLSGVDGLRQVKFSLDWLRSVGARVNGSCGFHVHVGFPVSPTFDGDALGRLVAEVARHQAGLYAITGTRTREQSIFCLPVKDHPEYIARWKEKKPRDWPKDRYKLHERLEGRYDSGLHYHQNRYFLLNLQNLAIGKPTVEFRVFSPTLNATKAIAFVRVALGLVHKARAYKSVARWDWDRNRRAAETSQRGGTAGYAACKQLLFGLGWFKDQFDTVFGHFDAPGLPTLEDCRDELVRLARKYDGLSGPDGDDGPGHGRPGDVRATAAARPLSAAAASAQVEVIAAARGEFQALGRGVLESHIARTAASRSFDGVMARVVSGDVAADRRGILTELRVDLGARAGRLRDQARRDSASMLDQLGAAIADRLAETPPTPEVDPWDEVVNLVNELRDRITAGPGRGVVRTHIRNALIGIESDRAGRNRDDLLRSFRDSILERAVRVERAYRSPNGPDAAAGLRFVAQGIDHLIGIDAGPGGDGPDGIPAETGAERMAGAWRLTADPTAAGGGQGGRSTAANLFTAEENAENPAAIAACEPILTQAAQRCFDMMESFVAPGFDTIVMTAEQRRVFLQVCVDESSNLVIDVGVTLASGRTPSRDEVACSLAFRLGSASHRQGNSTVGTALRLLSREIRDRGGFAAPAA